jgi:hypothetical protein
MWWFLIRLFVAPAIAMAAWGALCNMIGITEYAFGYWVFFMAYVVAQQLIKARV